MSVELILASQSRARRVLLERAGIVFKAQPAEVDESAIKRTAKAAGRSATQAAQELARAKALKIAALKPEALVLGSDQMLECDGRWFDKAVDARDAAEQLAFLSGRTHALISAAALVAHGEVVWEATQVARMGMRKLSAEFIQWYLEKIGAAGLSGVGCYAIEGLGMQLFEAIEGESSVIMGLPLLPLLQELRARGLVQT